jgi:hypothetical protein
MTRYRVFVDASRSLPPERFQRARYHDPVQVERGSFEQRGSGKSLDEDALRGALEKLVEQWDKPRVESDPEAAKRVRAALDISRRDAADRDLWIFLNSTVGWDYCVWRWVDRIGALTRTRVTGYLDRSALARLWWMAELVRDEAGDKNRLPILLRNSDRAVQLFERPRLLRRQRLMRPLLEVTDRRFGQWDEAGYREFSASSRAYFGVRLPEAIDEPVIEEVVDRLAKSTTVDS